MNHYGPREKHTARVEAVLHPSATVVLLSDCIIVVIVIVCYLHSLYPATHVMPHVMNDVAWLLVALSSKICKHVRDLIHPANCLICISLVWACPRVHFIVERVTRSLRCPLLWLRTHLFDPTSLLAR